MTFEEWWKGCDAWDGSDYPPYPINAAWEAATLAERERCAKETDYYATHSITAKNIAEAIRKGE